MSIGILILRLAIGLTLAAHGAQKLFGWFGGYGLTGTGGFLEQLGFVPGRRNALFAGLAEVGGGLLLALGLATPLAAAMIVAAARGVARPSASRRSEEHTSELQSLAYLVCRLLLEKKKKNSLK